ncbi:MAG TPA: carbonic anhydrase family protein [Lamprocystis sp. (in: g-proteobacteria)]|nr:carbonic anhydrase family protein [Lamprocystis sp. (in: g-proteobacteria)]
MTKDILSVALVALALGLAPAMPAAADDQAPATGHASVAGHAHWAYEGTEGPEHWGELDPGFGPCAAGVDQTPIDIEETVEAELPPLAIDYRTLGQEVVNNGHTIQVNVAPGSTLMINGVPFELKQFHFHTPSENEVGAKHFAMEGHLVHADQAGHLAVIGVLYQLGDADPTIAQVWAASPPEAGTSQAPVTPVDPKTLLPQARDYYAFSGSLTTPPCTEGVRWMLMKEPLTVSPEQVAYLEHAVHGHNNRPVQPVNARLILR